MRARTSVTGTVQAVCGCIGTIADDGGSQLHAHYPYFVVRVAVACPGGPNHPYPVRAGTIERFAYGVQPLAAAT